MSDLETRWTEIYGLEPPLPFRLREGGVDGWFRIHTLPGSKRYAETDEEAGEVLRRVSAVGDAVLGPIAQCHLVMVEAEGEHYSATYAAVRRTFGLTHAWQFNDLEDDELLWSVHTTEVRWSGERFASLLRQIAQDEIANVLWFAESGSVLAPYDGGVDVFTRPPTQATALKTRFADWLSPCPDGL